MQIGCTQSSNKKLTNTKPKLTLLWQTDTVLTTVESVIYDEANDFIYTSNIEGKPENKDQIGSISKLDLKGNVIQRNWISGLNAPKGMDIFDGTLYVADIDQLIEIDIKMAKIMNIYDIDGAKFLNDVAISKAGTVYFSDTYLGRIFQLRDGNVSVLMDFPSPNGLFVDAPNTLLAVSWGEKTFNRIDLKTKQVTPIASEIENPDGIEAVGDGSYLVSSWHGMVHHISRKGAKKLILDTNTDKVFAADIDYIPAKRMLLVPTFFKNKVMAYIYNTK